MRLPNLTLAAAAAFSCLCGGCVSRDGAPPVLVNSLGMELVRIEPGNFRMGNNGEIDYGRVGRDEKSAPPYLGRGSANPYLENGPLLEANPLEWDEAPVHPVEITRPFYMASTPVTNAQYEQFRPEHRELRGKRGFSGGDDEAVLFVSWDDAVAFTRWLSEKEGEPYRLPTEAEWEYAARSGTVTAYSTGDTLPEAYYRHQVMNRSHELAPDSVDLTVGQTAPNSWGLKDMHGLVEEWCLDWYGPYPSGPQTDPRGMLTGTARVTRGGSHSTGLPFLRSANRLAALPGTRSFLIGFRVVKGELPDGKETLLPPAGPPLWAKDVRQTLSGWGGVKASVDTPVFLEPRTFTRVPQDANGPLYFIHNHEPALAALPNGDLLAIWFTTVIERGREMVIAGARLRKGADEWDPADVFFHVPDRNLTGQALWWDGDKTIYHFSGVGAGDHWRDLSLVMRTSTDNGATWTQPSLIGPEYGLRHQPIDAVMRSSDSSLVLLCDADWRGDGGSAVHISGDGGKTWSDPGAGAPEPDFAAGKSGAWIAGIHAGIVELKDGRWMALGRGNEIEGRMPMSISSDKGRTWTYSASSLPPIHSAQRLALTRLREGPLLLVSFDPGPEQEGAVGRAFPGSGMYAALSYDEGRTWPVKKLVTPGGPPRILKAPCNYRWGSSYSLLDGSHAEARGYLTVEQSPDGMIHVLSSGTHYSFNLSWVEQPPAPEAAE